MAVIFFKAKQLKNKYFKYSVYPDQYMHNRIFPRIFFKDFIDFNPSKSFVLFMKPYEQRLR